MDLTKEALYLEFLDLTWEKSFVFQLLRGNIGGQ